MIAFGGSFEWLRHGAGEGRVVELAHDSYFSPTRVRGADMGRLGSRKVARRLCGSFDSWRTTRRHDVRLLFGHPASWTQ